MKPTKQLVYLPVEITEEFWTKWDNGEKPDYDLANVETGENIESWVNEKEGYFFTPKELNEYTANVIRQALETAADKVKVRFTDKTLSKTEISVESITNTFEETFKRFEL